MRFVPRSQHSVSRKRIDQDALKVLYRLHRFGYKAFLVGGSVRDMLLGKSPKDFDISTDAHPYEVKKLFRNCRIVGRRFRLAHILFAQGKVIEVSTFRRKSEYDEGDKEQNGPRTENTFGTPEQDAFRRDLTINGLFYNIADFTIVDYVGGLEDLKAGVVRTIGDPYLRFLEDPVRMFRAIRHAARNNFVIDKNTWEAILAQKHLIRDCPESRVREEFLRDLRGGASAIAIRLMSRSGLLFELLPEMRMIAGPDPEPEMPESALADLRVTDRLIRERQVPNDAILFAALLAPLVEKDLQETSFPDGRGRRKAVYDSVRNRVKPLAQSLIVPKKITEEVCQILYAQHQIHSAIGSGRIPRQLKSKQYFDIGMEFYQIEQSARGDHPVSAWPSHPPPAQPRYAAMLSDPKKAKGQAARSGR